MKLRMVFLVAGLMVSGSVSAYQKFCYADYRLGDMQEVPLLKDRIGDSAPFVCDQATYEFDKKNGAVTCYVQLNSQDKRNVHRAIVHEEPTTLITPEMIEVVAGRKKSKPVVGWVLNDFERMQQATLDDVKAVIKD